MLYKVNIGTVAIQRTNINSNSSMRRYQSYTKDREEWHEEGMAMHMIYNIPANGLEVFNTNKC